MKFYVTLNHYTAGSGFKFSESFDKGTCENAFSASEYIAENGIETDTDDGWIEVDIAFYSDDADPAFDAPVAVSVFNNTVAAMF